MPSVEVDLLIDFFAGGVSMALGKTVAAPFERVKILLQTQDVSSQVRKGEVPRYSGIGNCFSRVYQEQGLRSFWRGNFTNCFKYVPAHFYTFTMKDMVQSMLPRAYPRQNYWFAFAVNSFSGLVAGCSSLLIVYPLDYARTRLAADVGKQRAFSGLADCFLKSFESRGLLGVYGGFSAVVMVVLPYRSLQIGLYDTYNQYNPYRRDYTTLGVASKFAVSQLSTLTSCYMAFPFDTVARRLQMQSDIADRSKRLYSGVVDCMTKMMQREGITSLFKGAGVNVLRVTSATAMVVYDSLKEKYCKAGGRSGSSEFEL